MPVVRIEQTQRTAPLPGVRRQAAENDLSAGVALEDQRARTDLAAANFGGTVAQVGIQLTRSQREEAEREKERADQIAVLNAGNVMAAWENKRFYDPDTGAMTVRGKDSLGLPEKVMGEFQQVASTLEASMQTPRQKEAFARLKLERQQNIDLSLRRHVSGEIQRYQGQELQATVENARSAAISNADDPRRVGLELGRAVDAIRTHAPHLGLGPEQIQMQVDATTSATHVGVIEQLLATDKDQMASVYFDETKSQIKGESLARIEKAIESASTSKVGLTTATDIWAKLGPKDDLGAINLDAMEEAARTKFKDDPKKLEATMHFLRERKAATDAGRKDREEANTGALWVAASQGASLSQLSKMPQFLAAPGRLQAQLSDYIVSKAEHLASRAAAEEGRAYTKEQRGFSELERKGWGRFWEMSDPVTLNATTENQLQSLRGELGDEHVNRLLVQKRSLSKSEDAVRAATIDDDLFKTTAETAGLKAYTAKTESEKNVLGQLKNAVETQIDVEQQKKGKLLTRDEKQALMHTIIDQKVMLNQWFTDPERIAATVTNPDDRKAAYVPVAKIPPAVLSQYLNYARSLPGAERLSDGDIQRRFSAKFEHAYALRLIGGTRAEIEAALQGKE